MRAPMIIMMFAFAALILTFTRSRHMMFGVV